MKLPAEKFDLVSIDYYGAGAQQLKKYKGYVAILSMVERLTGLGMFIPVKSRKVQEAIDIVKENYCGVFGFPKHIHSDNEASFGSGAFVDFCKKHETALSTPGVYHHPQNGQVERAHRWLNEQLQIHFLAGETNWVELCPLLAFQFNANYNATVHESPYYLAFGREASVVQDLEREAVKSIIDPVVMGTRDKRLYSEQKERELMKWKSVA